MRILRLLAFGMLMTAGLASAQSYPDKSKPIRLIVPFSAGASADLMARGIARGMADLAGLNVIVDNRPGGEGVIGIMAVKMAAPDGYTMLITSGSTQAVNPHVLPNLPYDPITDFVPLGGVAKAPLYFNVSPGIAARNLGEFIAMARANPGKHTVGSGSSTMLMAGEMLNQAAGIQLLSVPYKNATDAVTALGAGQLDMVIVDAAMASVVYPRGVRALATTAGSRTARLPTVPTAKEEGLKDYEFVGWFGAYFPAKTPPEVAATMRDLLARAVKTRYVTDVMNNFSMEPLEVDLAAFQRADYERWGKTVRASKQVEKK